MFLICGKTFALPVVQKVDLTTKYSIMTFAWEVNHGNLHLNQIKNLTSVPVPAVLY